MAYTDLLAQKGGELVLTLGGSDEMHVAVQNT